MSTSKPYIDQSRHGTVCAPTSTLTDDGLSIPLLSWVKRFFDQLVIREVEQQGRANLLYLTRGSPLKWTGGSSAKAHLTQFKAQIWLQERVPDESSSFLITSEGPACSAAAKGET